MARHVLPSSGGKPSASAPVPPDSTGSGRVLARRAASRVRVVPGHDFDAFNALDSTTITCGSGSFGDPTPTMRRGGSRGSHALGWSFGPSHAVSAGVMSYVTDPMHLYWLGTEMLAPGGSGSGYVFADVYDPSQPNGYWFGYAPWSVSGSGWRFLERADKALTWTYIEGGSQQPVDGAKTIADFSGEQSTAWVGFTAGCNDATTYFDELNAADLDSDVTYDFEGTPTDTDVYRYNASTEKLARIAKATTVTVRYGVKPWIAGDNWDRGDDQRAYNDDDNLLAFTGNLYRRAYGSSSFRSAGRSTANADNDYWAWFRVAPKRRTTYQIRYGGSAANEASRSSFLTYNVRRALSAQVVDKTLFTGQSMVLRGTLRPGDRGIKLYVQRKTGGRWKTLRSGHSGRRGDYRLPFTVRSAGTWHVRVRAASGKGVLSNNSPDRYVTVKRRPKKVTYTKPEPTGTTTYTPPPTTSQPTVAPPVNHLP